jgi:hypothetical protein
MICHASPQAELLTADSAERESGPSTSHDGVSAIYSVTPRS